MTEPPVKKKLSPKGLIRRALRRSDADGKRLYSDEEALNTLTACVLGIMVKFDIRTFGEDLQETVGLALLHARLHADMSQDEFNDKLLRFLSANPPRQELLDELNKVFKKIDIRAEKRRKKQALAQSQGS